ncbi:quinolinate synthase NadA [Bdellovibrio sp. SKB1291214]|uniref:quinolinate synthase NadA n=1 Tax=Bdellovibrio sp. SKB1291214 TaxID=1732569 RepID=UPI000B51E0BC|nr:quinolinate synthase NadA [Bdellovibrio sp. SKB1291214]UYL10726.1 quinolinate synthase NadA [Bdellovibrio sp. SKB1291214]
MSYDVAAEIQRLKKEKNAVVLAHYYEDGDIQDVADYVGDSFFLAKKGQEVKEQVILLAGVVFMAESVKIMNPTKTVLVPELEASCSLVKGAPYDKYLAWRQQHRDGIAVTYINSSAEVKSISDVIITSSNAQQIVNAIPKDRKILFGPDQHLGRWLSKKLGREMEFWNGSCEVHVLFNANRLAALIKEHPDALILAHPECDDSVLAYANVIGSTQHLLDSVSSNPHKKFIVATETGIFHQMQKRRPDATFIQAPVVDEGCQCNDCPYMKMNNLEKIKRALETLEPQMNLPESLRLEAKVSLDRMMDITSGKAVTWPKEFAL